MIFTSPECERKKWCVVYTLMHHYGYVFGYRIVGSGTEYRINGKVRGHLWEVYVHVQYESKKLDRSNVTLK